MSVGKITKNASSLFVGKVVSSVLGFFTGALIARLLEPSELGLIGIAMSTITLIYIITDLGLNQAIIYLIPRLLKEESKGGVKHLINRVYGIKIVLGVAVMIFLYLSSEWLALLYNEPALGQVFRFFSILFVFFVVFNGLLNLFIAFQKMSYVTYSTIMLSISKFLPIAHFFLAGFLGVVYGYVAMYAISALLTIVLLSRLYPKGKVVQKVALTELMKVSMGMFLMMLCYSLVSQASSLMLGLLSTATEVAYFNISISIGLLVSFGGVALGSSMRPAITEMVSKGSKELVRRTLKYVVYGTLPITSLAIALGSPIIRFVYTEKYLPALPAYNWIVLSFGLTGLFIFLFDVARAIDRSFSVTKS
ncbi:MAG: oligosaccharide flippase family protein, partial [Candidatus Aenigmarchaeota archaeon]|nr:oligosaccharide flippase family protein [Candidatus Aenigmarchaeota archaeon]